MGDTIRRMSPKKTECAAICTFGFYLFSLFLIYHFLMKMRFTLLPEKLTLHIHLDYCSAISRNLHTSP